MSTSTGNSHPKGLYVLFATEMWERFSYYGMRAILTLFMTKALLFDKIFAGNLYASYTGLVYLTPLIGGYIADRYWGNRRSIITGGLLMALGQFCLFTCASLYVSAQPVSAVFFYTGLGFMIIGNGFFKPNISSMVGQLYSPGDKRTDAAYTIFYMGINVGAGLGPIVCGFFGETNNPADFKWAFLAAGIGMILSVLLFQWLKKEYVVTPEGKAVGITPEGAPEMPVVKVVFGLLAYALIAIGLLYIDTNALGIVFPLLILSTIAIVILIFSDKSLTSIEKEKIGVIFIVAFFVVFFWSAFEQAGASLTFFADEQTDRMLGLKIPHGYLYFFSTTLLAYFGYLTLQAKKHLSVNDPKLKKAAYILLTSLAGGLLYYNYSRFTSGESFIDLTEIPASFFQSLNSIFVVSCAPLFALLWVFLGKRNMEPSSPFKMAIGLFLLCIGYLIIAFGVKGVDPTVKVSMLWITAMYGFHSFGELCLSPIGLSLVNKLAPLRFASLLMAVWFLANAAANKLVGPLSSLYPAGPAEFKKASDAGIDLPSILSGQTTASAEQITKLQELKLQTSFSSIAGIQITNLYEFFMVFVVLSGIASLILFFLTKKLKQMMHEDSE